MKACRSRPDILAGVRADAACITSWSRDDAGRLVAEGIRRFCIDSIGDGPFWREALRLRKAIGGAGDDGLESWLPLTAIGFDGDPESFAWQARGAIVRGKMDVGDPAVTMSMLRREAAFALCGPTGHRGRTMSIGISGALCCWTIDELPGVSWPDLALDDDNGMATGGDPLPFQLLLGVDRAFDGCGQPAAVPEPREVLAAAVVIPAAFGLAHGRGCLDRRQQHRQCSTMRFERVTMAVVLAETRQLGENRPALDCQMQWAMQW